MQVVIDPNDPVLEGVDHHAAEHMVRAFDIMVERLHGVSNETAMWSLALLVAKVFSACAMQDKIQAETSKRFADMLRVAYPAVVRMMETATRQHERRQPFDA